MKNNSEQTLQSLYYKIKETNEKIKKVRADSFQLEKELNQKLKDLQKHRYLLSKDIYLKTIQEGKKVLEIEGNFNVLNQENENLLEVAKEDILNNFEILKSKQIANTGIITDDKINIFRNDLEYGLVPLEGLYTHRIRLIKRASEMNTKEIHAALYYLKHYQFTI